MTAFLAPVVEEHRRSGGMPRHAVLAMAAWATWVRQSVNSGAPEIVDRRADELRAAARRLTEEPAAFLRAGGLPAALWHDRQLVAQFGRSVHALRTGGLDEAADVRP
jgi:hypothetical protein